MVVFSGLDNDSSGIVVYKLQTRNRCSWKPNQERVAITIQAGGDQSMDDFLSCIQRQVLANFCYVMKMKTMLNSLSNTTPRLRHYTSCTCRFLLKQNTMIYTNMPQNCVVFLLPVWPTLFVRKVKRKPCNFEANLCRSLYSTCTYVLLQHLSNLTMHFIINGYKRFSKTNSTDPRQRVPLFIWQMP